MGMQSNGLDDVARRFERWRQGLHGSGRIPNELWHLAAEVALVCGVRETAQRLRVDAGRLKKWMQEISHSSAPAPASFVELSPLRLGATSECTFELESRTGRKLRITLKGAATAQALALGRLLCEEASS